jgi:hypothetical protein
LLTGRRVVDECGTTHEWIGPDFHLRMSPAVGQPSPAVWQALAGGSHWLVAARNGMEWLELLFYGRGSDWC